MKFYIAAIFSLVLMTAQAQTSSKVSKLYFEAENYFVIGQHAQAIELLEKALQKDAHYVRAVRLLTRIYKETGDYINSIRVMDNYALNYPKEAYKAYLEIGILYQLIEDFDQSLRYLNKTKDNEFCSENTKLRVDKEIGITNFRKHQKENPIDVKLDRLGPEINSEHDEYLPSITADGSKMMFTRRFAEGLSVLGNEDFYQSDLNDTVWTMAKPLGEIINTDHLEGALSLSPDGKRLFFAAEKRNGNFGGFDIYYSYIVDGKWTRPQNISRPVNNEGWESQPSISADGKELYFASKRLGSFGGIDLWVSHLRDNRWTVPQNLGDKINTERDEQCPFIHPDGKTLYFSSDGHLGMGQSDIYMTRRNEAGEWSDPINLGYPLNTKYEDGALFVTTNGRSGVFAREYEATGLDLVQFEMPEFAKPEFVSYVKGKVIDKVTKQPLPAIVRLNEVEEKQDEIIKHSDDQGQFLITLNTNRTYGCTVEYPGYTFYSDRFELGIKFSGKPFDLTIELNPIAVQAVQSITLRNIYFDTDKSELLPASFPELARLVDFIQQNHNKSVTIVGHTDNSGDEQYNLNLSAERAASVKQYLIAQGISSSKLTSIGKGENEPISDNDSEEGKALNRRVEILLGQ